MNTDFASTSATMRIVALSLLCFWTTAVCAIEVDGVDLKTIDRQIVREPRYQGQPHYALFVFGQRAEHRAWFVIDGDSLAYIDRNGNGDLTDPEDRVELDIEATEKIRLGGPGAYRAMHVFPLGEIQGTRLKFHLWVRDPDFDISKHPQMRDHWRKYDEMNWINGSLMRTAKDDSQAQNPLLLTTSPSTAQISHFNGPLVFELAFRERQELQPWPKRSHLEVNIGCLNLLAEGCDSREFALSPLTTSEIPADFHPVAMLTYEELEANPESASQNVILDQRCCGDRLYAPVRLPKNVSGDTVEVAVNYPAASGLVVQSAKFQVPIQRGFDPHNESLYVLFRNPDITLKQAVHALRKQGLDVKIQANLLHVTRDELPLLFIQLKRGDEIQELAASLGTTTESAASLAECDACFEVGFQDAQKWLDEKETLDVVRSALQQVTRGYQYSTWDKQLALPK